MKKQKFGRLTLLTIGRSNKSSCKCRCDCGEICFVRYGNLKSGNTRSCGCLNDETKTKHGMNKTKEHRAWNNMKRRCYNEKGNPNYKNYGGRGIRVCDEWKDDFMSFYTHIGPAPSKDHTVDRIDNEGHYEIGNVKWSTRKEQNANRRKQRNAK